MNLAIVVSRGRRGIDAPEITVEIHLAPGLPGFNIVGLPETAVKEAKDRVRSAIQNAQFEFPARRITVNLAPADLPKEGGRFDLAIALGILAASGQIPKGALAGREFIGELGLGGDLRPVPGALSAALAAGQAGRALVLPIGNAAEAALAPQVSIHGCDHLLSASAFLHGRLQLADGRGDGNVHPAPVGLPDLDDVRGQEAAKRALAVAAAGGHNLLFYGPPGTGKSMLAARLPGLLPPLTGTEELEVATLYSAVGKLDRWPPPRPFRAPHHTASAAALVGGGGNPRPGEVSLAHCGVLFLDELPEFSRRVLEVLREPMESGEICISRVRDQIRFPARFQLIAAMNPCPCGYLGDSLRACRCGPDQILRYRSRLSGPLLDRIDLQVPVPRLSPGQLSAGQWMTSSPSEAAPCDDPGTPPQTEQASSSALLRFQVRRARRRQLQRGGLNSQLNGRQAEAAASLDREQLQWLENAVLRLGLSARVYHRVLKVARTLADLDDRSAVQHHDLCEALQYRSLDRAQ